MSDEGTFEQVIGLIWMLCVVTLLVGQLAGQPVLLSYVETESMSPTMEPGDGFVPVPELVAGPVEKGDIVVFEAKELHGGGLTTHRVVGETERGYITQGDGNPFADQDNEEPPVKRPQIVATALEINGEAVVIPGVETAAKGVQSVLETTQRQIASLLGTQAVVGTQGLGIAAFVLTLVWYVFGGSERADARDRSRETGLNSRLVVGACTLLLVLTATAAMVVPAGASEYGVVSASFDSDRPNVIPQGESNNVSYPVDNSGLVPVVTHIEPTSHGVAVEPQAVVVQPRQIENATVTLHAPPETGYYRRYVVEHRYLAVLPSPILSGLYEIHPWAPILCIDLFFGGLFYWFGRRVVGDGRIRDRSRPTHSLDPRLQRLLPDWLLGT